MLVAHGDLLTCSHVTRGTGRTSSPLCHGPESLAATCTASTFGAGRRAPAFQSCLTEAVCRPESFSGRVAPPASPRLRTTGTLALRFKRRIQLCDPLYGTCCGLPGCARTATPLSRGSATGAGVPACRELTPPLDDGDPRRRRAAGRRRRRRPARSPARASARSCRWSGSPTFRPRPADVGAVAQGLAALGHQARAAGATGPLARSSSSAARPVKSPLSHPITQPSPAWSGVMPGPSSWPCSGRPGLEAQGVAGAQPGRGDARSPARRPRTLSPPRRGTAHSTPSSPV